MKAAASLQADDAPARQTAPAAQSVRDRLRAATAQIHQALHHAAPFARIADGGIDIAGYGALLQFLHRYHSSMALPCAAGARALGAPALAVAHQTRLMMLENDLSHLGISPHPQAGLPRARESALEGVSFNIGVLYTVQGSTLGGKVIHRQLDYLLPGADGRRFFRGTAADGAHWQELCAGLERRNGDLAALAEGARFAFACFEAMLPA